MANFLGTPGNDYLIGSASNDALYGYAGNDTLIADLGNDILDGGLGDDILDGGAGNDIYRVDSSSDVIVESANSGTDQVQSAVSWTLGADLENLTLTGTNTINGTGNALNNTIVGNAANNYLVGGDGNDALNGGAGYDTLDGGAGNDNYVVDSSGDVIVESANSGTDQVQSAVSWTLGAELENLRLLGTDSINGTGNALNNSMTGNAANNRLEGGSGNDVLNGGAGNDTLDGGAGNDIYRVDSSGDITVESPSSGTDLVQSTVSWTLGAELENLSLLGTDAINGTGNALNNTIVGNAANNYLVGGDGNDALNGGAGNDTLEGGSGNDAYSVDSSDDQIVESADSGIDAVFATANYTLSANIENLTLNGTNPINGTGNALSNSIVGNAANNRLEGGEGNDTLNGKAGNDTLEGGAGDDFYSVDSTGDVIIESANSGTDWVQSFINYTLADVLENMVLGASASTGTGNALNNLIIATAGNHSLVGGGGDDSLVGGPGNDTLNGGTGNDFYSVDSTGDRIFENSGEGTDLVESSINYTLQAELENLTLIKTAITGTGNALNNMIVGTASNNSLVGGEGEDSLIGGLGNDTLKGGTGNDFYSVDSTGDRIFENSGEGTDLVESSISWTLEATLENLILTGTNTISGTGNVGDNTIAGNAADNTLDGGAGNDMLAGGIGNDVYIVDSVGDSIVENPGEGTDLVQSSADFTLEAELENLTLLDSAYYGQGNELDNTITGNDTDNELVGGDGNDILAGGLGYDILDGGTGDNSLHGGEGNDIFYGGLGANTLSGGAGDDIYYVDSTSDIIIESAGGGSDLISSSVTKTLDAEVENLELTGSGAINGTGNSLDNTIAGNLRNNILDGGDGNDTLMGSNGSDSLLGKAGNDSLDGGVSSDTLDGGLGNDTLTGSSANDSLIGNAGNDSLSGDAGNDSLLGGAGNDTLTGGNNRDHFQYSTGRAFATADVGVDLIADFGGTGGNRDRIVLSKTTFNTFSALGSSLNSQGLETVINDADAATKSASLVYNTVNGNLFYNPNGAAAGLGSGGLFATLTDAPTLAYTDFTLIS